MLGLGLGWLLDKCINYCVTVQDFVCNVSIKNIFIDMYNHCLNFYLFLKKEEIHSNWLFPPPFVESNSFCYSIFWYEWIIEGCWTFKDDGTDKENKGGDYWADIICWRHKDWRISTKWFNLVSMIAWIWVSQFKWLLVDRIWDCWRMNVWICDIKIIANLVVNSIFYTS